jgi:uncharacterized alpha-E superfamily protein
MISRVADHCFWMGRYVERTENAARVLSATHGLVLDGELPAPQCWLPVLIVAGEEPAFVERFGSAAAGEEELVQDYMTWDEKNLASLVSSVGAARENARSIRDLLSIEVWEAMNEIYLWLLGEDARDEYAENRSGFYGRLRSHTELVLGLVRTTMLHDQALDFVGLGVLLERAGWTARVLDVHHHALLSQGIGDRAAETGLWLAILRACSGYEPFLRHGRGQISGLAVANFLLLEPRFPRSVRYCVEGARRRLSVIRPPDRDELPGGRSLTRLLQLDAWLRQVELPRTDHSALHQVLTQVVDETAAVCEGLSEELLGQSVDPLPSSERNLTEG